MGDFYSDILQKDKQILAKLTPSMEEGEHLRLLFAMTHSDILRPASSHETSLEMDQLAAFRYLREHIEDRFDVDFILKLYGALTHQEIGAWKQSNTYFEEGDSFYITTSAEKTPRVMKDLCDRFAYLNCPELSQRDDIFKFILHFICIHPFINGNGRMSAFLLQALLYKAGFKASLYVPFDSLLSGVYASKTSIEIRRASGVFYGQKELEFEPYIAYMKSLLEKSYDLMLEIIN